MTDIAIETLFAEDRRYPPPPAFAAQANARADVYDVPFEEFWEREGRERVTWFEPFTALLEWELPYAKWYVGGKINVAYNCLDRHVEAGRGDKVAYYYEGEPVGERAAITYSQLLEEVVKAANGLRVLGVRRGTPVGIYMGMGPGLPVAMLACARLGAPHTVVFGGFSAESLADRLNDMQCEVLLTQDEGWRRGQVVPLKRNADEALESCPGVRSVVVGQRTRGTCRWWRAAISRGRSSPRASRPTRRPAPASRWTPRTSCTSSTRAGRPRSRRGSRTRPPATWSASRRRTTTCST